MTNDTVSDVEPVVQPADPLLIEPAPLSRTTQLWQPWTMIIPAMVLLPFLCLAFSWQISPSTDEMLLTKRHHRTGTEAAPEPKRASSQLNIFIPDDDGMLHRRAAEYNFKSRDSKDPFEPMFLGTTINLAGTSALEALFAAAPQYFPTGTQVEDLTLEPTESGASIAHVSLNSVFWNSDYWAMDSRANLAIQAIAQTLADVYRQSTGVRDFQILLLRDGQNPGALGQDDISDPISPDDSFLARSVLAVPSSDEKTPPVTVTAP